MNSQVGRGVTYGRKLNTQESKTTKKTALGELRSSYAKTSLKERLFAIDNPYSLVGKVAAITPATSGSVKQEIANLPSRLTNGVASLFNGSRLVGSLAAGFGISQKVYAAGSQDFAADNNFFGVDQWGWSQAEYDKLSSDENFDPINNAAWVANNISQAESDKYAACYKDYSSLSLPDYCNGDFLASDEALHWRANALYGFVTDQLAGVDEDRETPTTPDTASPIPAGSLGGDSSSQKCGAGTDGGIGDGYSGGKLFKIRLCKVHGITVNAQVASNLDRMINAAAAAGVRLTGGGFRTMASQIALRNAHGCSSPSAPSSSCSPPTARPGYSNHQMGLAIDFGNCGSHSTGCWKWLNANAKSYGFLNFKQEPWHWSPDGK
jgi:hypothetical protein